MLVKPHVRKDGIFELRKVEVEGSYRPHPRDNVSCISSDRVFVDEYLSRPLKKLKVGEVVLVLPTFKRFTVVGGFENGSKLELELVPERNFAKVAPVAVDFRNVRVLQEFERDGYLVKILLVPDFRGLDN